MIPTAKPTIATVATMIVTFASEIFVSSRAMPVLYSACLVFMRSSKAASVVASSDVLSNATDYPSRAGRLQVQKRLAN